jgi:hypothetical protein
MKYYLVSEEQLKMIEKLAKPAAFQTMKNRRFLDDILLDSKRIEIPESVQSISFNRGELRVEHKI